MFDKWTRPLLLFALASGLFATTLIISLPAIEELSFLLLCLTFFLLFISAVYQLLKRRWLKGLLTGAVFCLGVFAFIIFAVISFFISDSGPDPFTDGLTLPTNIDLNDPIGTGFQEARADTVAERNYPDFVLYKSFQPGLYEYDIWLDNTAHGTVYLKAYEITKNTPLSTDRLLKASAVKVANTTGELQKFGTSNHFTIYEGDWGKPYAARFEVWFKPDSGGADRKIMEKTFIIEGWQR